MTQDNFHFMDNAFKQISISTEGLSDEITHFKPKILNTIDFIRNKKNVLIQIQSMKSCPK